MEIPTTIHDDRAELVDLASLTQHPDNYREHPAAQIDHLVASIREHGQYRPIVVARDLTILAGHGVAQALQRCGFRQAWIVRLDIDPDSTRARKILAGDNELARLAIDDESMLAGMLVRIAEEDDLLGTGWSRDEAEEAQLRHVEFDARVPSLDELAEQYGETDESAFWPEIRVTVRPATLARYEQIIGSIDGTTDADRFARLLEAVNVSALR